MNVGTAADFTARMRSSFEDEDSRPIAVLIGSGVSAGAVASPVEIVETVVKVLGETDGQLLRERLALISDPTEQYQAAFSFLGLRKAPAYRDRIIRLATLAAYEGEFELRTDFDSQKLMEYESEVDRWKIPSGLESLGRIWSGMPVRTRGPIITTNFDPLCEIGIKRAGGAVTTRVIETDGQFVRDSQISDISTVVHLHGFWRDSATLSMVTQLTLERPALAGSLRSLLSHYTVVVIGYGGWNDAVMRQLLQVIGEQGATELDVVWCYFGTEEELHSELASDAPISQLKFAPGNVQFYASIDSNLVLPELERALASYLSFADERRVTRGAGSLIGWRPVPSARAGGHVEDLTQSALSFFDGRLPNWQDAASEFVPKRDIVRTISNGIGAAIRDRRASLSVITGPSGEGKTTALMQIATVLSRNDSAPVVLYCDEGFVGSVEEVLNLPPTSPHLLVIDDGYRNIERLRELVVKLNEAALNHVHLLVGSRDTDWTSAGGFTFAWGRLTHYNLIRLRGMTRPDAAAIVQSWERLGQRALGQLASVEGTEARIDALVKSASDEEKLGEGAFLGAMLAIRYGAGLVDHIRELLIRIGDRHIQVLSGPTDKTLLEAFYVLAFPQSFGVRSMSDRVLASALGIDVFELLGSVLLPLGDEAAIAFSSQNVVVRHRLIAQASIDLAPELGIDLKTVARRVVTAAVDVIENHGFTPELSELAYLASKIDSSPLANEAANAAVEACPNRLSYRTSYSRALRNDGRASEAAMVCEASLALLTTARDAASGSRALLTEWSVVEGNLGRFARGVVLCGLALQDDTHPWRLINAHAATACICLAFSLRKQWEVSREAVYLTALSGLVYLADGLTLSAIQENWINQAGDLAFKNGAAVPDRKDKAASQLRDGCFAALGGIERPLSSDLPLPRFRFSELAEFSRY